MATVAVAAATAKTPKTHTHTTTMSSKKRKSQDLKRLGDPIGNHHHHHKPWVCGIFFFSHRVLCKNVVVVV